MTTVNVHEAKAQLSRLIERALAGEDVVIARRNKPLVRLVVVREARPRRELGTSRGKIRMADDFDAPLDDFSAYRQA